ncbi:hypothetical protein ACFW5S_32755 [Streptomyces olivaceus]|uniref:hypothetical protein n=1 Tax=Streptomyces olivaceus TaxID=47716 RepID=UPI0033BBF85E
MHRTVALAAAVTALLFPVSAHAAPARAAAPGNTLTLTVREALDALTVAEEDTTEYKRSWTADPGTGRLTAWLETKTVWHPIGV